MIFKMLYYFFGIASLSGGKNCQASLSRLHHPHSSQDFFLVIPEKGELSEEKSDNHQNDLIAKNQHKYPQKGLPKPKSGLIEAYPTGDIP